jgi:hypothetical protein
LAIEVVAIVATNPTARANVESCFLSEILIVPAFQFGPHSVTTVAGANKTGAVTVPSNTFVAMTRARATQIIPSLI